MLEQAEAVEAVLGEVLEQLGERVGLEHGAVRARLHLGAASRGLGLAERLLRRLGGVDGADRDRLPFRVARDAFAGGERHDTGVGHPVLRGEPGGRGDGQLDDPARHVAVELERPGGGDRPGGDLRLLGRRQRRRRLVVALHGRWLRGRSKAGERVVGRRGRCRLERPARELAQRLVVHAVRRSAADAAVTRHAQLDDVVLDERRLVHLRAGVAGEARELGVDDRLGLLARDGRERAFREVERGHGRTPTWTFRNRLAGAPCETCALWPGWPLPQFVSP